MCTREGHPSFSLAQRPHQSSGQAHTDLKHLCLQALTKARHWLFRAEVVMGTVGSDK